MTGRGIDSSSPLPETLEGWLGRRVPEVPSVFLPRLSGRGGSPVSPDALGHLGEEALTRSLDHPGRDREGAFDLLVADAFITYACEILCEAEDPEMGMEELLEKLGKRFSP